MKNNCYFAWWFSVETQSPAITQLNKLPLLYRCFRLYWQQHVREHQTLSWKFPSRWLIPILSMCCACFLLSSGLLAISTKSLQLTHHHKIIIPPIKLTLKVARPRHSKHRHVHLNESFSISNTEKDSEIKMRRPLLPVGVGNKWQYILF